MKYEKRDKIPGKKNPSKNIDLREHGIREEVMNLKEEHKQSTETRLERQEEKGHKRPCVPVHGVWTSF